MLAEVFEELYKLDDNIKTHTAILSLIQIIEIHWQIIDSKVYYKDGVIPSKPKMSIIVKIINDLKPPADSEEIEISDEDINKFIIYYKFFRLYQYDIYKDKTALDFYPEKFFIALIPDMRALFITTFNNKQHVFMPTYTNISHVEARDIFKPIIKSNSGYSPITSARQENKLLELYTLLIEPFIEWINEGPDTDENDLINTLSEIIGGPAKLAFVMLYGVGRLCTWLEKLQMLGCSDLYGLNKMFIYTLSILLDTNYRPPLKSEVEYEIYKNKFSLLEKPSTIDHKFPEVFKIMCDGLERGDKILSPKVPPELIRELLNYLIFTDNELLIKKMLLDKDRFIEVINMSAYTYTTHNDKIANLEVSFIVPYRSPIYLTTKYFGLFKQIYGPKVLNILAVSINPRLRQYVKDLGEVGINKEIFKNTFIRISASQYQTHKIIYNADISNICGYSAICPYGYRYPKYIDGFYKYSYDTPTDETYAKDENDALLSPKNITMLGDDIIEFINDCVAKYDENRFPIYQALMCLNAFMLKSGFELIKRMFINNDFTEYIEKIMKNVVYVSDGVLYYDINYNAYLISKREALEFYGIDYRVISYYMNFRVPILGCGKLKPPTERQFIGEDINFIHFTEDIYKAFESPDIFRFYSFVFKTQSKISNFQATLRIVRYVAAFIHAHAVANYNAANHGDAFFIDAVRMLDEIRENPDSFFNIGLNYLKYATIDETPILYKCIEEAERMTKAQDYIIPYCKYIIEATE